VAAEGAAAAEKVANGGRTTTVRAKARKVEAAMVSRESKEEVVEEAKVKSSVERKVMWTGMILDPSQI
jgi:hypothetical protein